MNLQVRKIIAPAAIGALACSLAVSAPAFAEINPPVTSDSVKRIQGVDRFATAIAASKAFDAERGSTVILANAESWADVIAATPLAAAKGANVLYTYAGELESRTKAELVRLAGLGVTDVLLVGGETVLSASLQSQVADLKDANGTPLNFTVDRIGGSDRYATALQLAAETVSTYEGSTVLAGARADVVANAKAQNAVADAQAQSAAATTAYTKASSAYITALTNLAQAQAERQILVGQLVTPLTPAQEAALKAEIATAQTAVVEAQQALIAAVTAGDEAAIKVAEENLVAAQADLKEKQDELTAAANAVATNAPLLTKIAAVDAKINGEKGLYAVATKAYADLEDALAKVNAAASAVAAAPIIATDAKAAAPALKKAYDEALAAAIKEGKDYPAFVATGANFADALAAGPAAAQGFDGEQGVVLLTAGSSVPADTKRYLDTGADVVAVGGWAAAAVDADKSYVGADRYETAALLAQDYQGTQLGLASGTVAADAVIAGALLGTVGGSVVLTDPTALPKATNDFFTYSYTGEQVIVFGGTAAVSTGVANQVRLAIGG